MANRLIIEKDTIWFEGFPDVDDNNVISLNIYGWGKVVLSPYIPIAILSCHNITIINDRKCNDKVLVNRLYEAGVKSGTRFLKSPNAYIADIYN